MWRARSVSLAGSVTTKASRVPSGENCKSEIDRRFSEASGIRGFVFSAAGISCPRTGWVKPATPSKKTAEILEEHRSARHMERQAPLVGMDCGHFRGAEG